MNKMTRILSTAASAGLLLSACGGYDREAAIKELTDGEFDEVTAICVVDELEEKIGTDKIVGTGTELTAEEEALVVEVTRVCLYNRGEFIAEMLEAGIDEEAAECITDGAEERLGKAKLSSGFAGIAPADQTVMVEISTVCLQGS